MRYLVRSAETVQLIDTEQTPTVMAVASLVHRNGKYILGNPFSPNHSIDTEQAQREMLTFLESTGINATPFKELK